MRAVIAVAAVVACGPPSAPQAPATVPRDVLPYDADFVASSKRLRATLARDGIELDTTPVIRTCDVPRADRDCARCDVATVLDDIPADLTDRVAIAFARYPSSVRKAARLEHLAFCRAITYERGADHGPAGLADPNTHRIYISVGDFREEYHGAVIEDAVHHEVFHLLDFETQGAHALADTEWKKLNPAGFVYRTGNADTKRPVGFVNTYATTNEMEDRASTFEYLMVRPDELCEMTAKDPALAHKVRLLWQRVAQVEGAERLGVTAPCAVRAASSKHKPRQPPAKRRGKPQLRLPGG